MTRLIPEATVERPSKHVSKKQKLAHTLLVEILAYQFASPVRWIETQDVFFSGKDPVERVIEIGPTNILCNMAKRTIVSKYAVADRFTSRDRKLLSFADHKQEIYSIYPEEPSNSPENPSSTNPTEHTAPTPKPQQTSVAEPTSVPPLPAVHVPDAPTSSDYRIRALVATKLKKSFEDVPQDASIKDLSAGKSTLQNEILGDLGNEFSAFPDSAEDKSLSGLGAAVPADASGALGKQSSTLLTKMISSKMPAGFNMTAVRDYLQSRWGLGPGRQGGVLLMAITSQPSSRLADEGAARGFLDSIVNRYAVHEGITLSTTSAENSGIAPAAIAVDAATLNAVQKDHKDYLTKQLRALAKFLKVDLAENVIGPNSGNGEEASHGSDLLQGEHGEVYQAGIVPMFDPKKTRVYDSWWAWAKQEAVAFFNDLQSGFLLSNDQRLADQIDAISNRSYAALLELIEYLASASMMPDASPSMLNPVHRLLQQCQDLLRKDPTFTYKLASARPRTTIESDGTVKYTEVAREGLLRAAGYVALLSQESGHTGPAHSLPLIHLKSLERGGWLFDKTNTELYMECLGSASDVGISFSGKTALVTGAGAGSIGEEIIKGLLKGGASVIVTTSRPVSLTATNYQSIYSQYGAKGSSLTLFQFNQGSVQDCEALINHIFDERTGLGQDLDYLLPFAAIPEAGREVDGIDDRSELAHRMMLINTLRILGFIKTQKESRGFTSRPTQVILPLSPNHGTFGGDGLYSESKLGLETVFNRWSSESWGGYLTVCGAVIGWTRGTGLMSANNIVAEAVESHNVMTFSTKEMAFNILGLMTPAVNLMCQDDPVYADLSGGLQSVADLKRIVSEARSSITETSEIRKALLKENQLYKKVTFQGRNQEARSSNFRPRANMRFDFPGLPDYESNSDLISDLKGMVDLSRVVVVVGYSELGPWGNARTRWEMEAFGEFSREGYVEMAWIMGLIKHFTGRLPGTNTQYAGWVDAKTGEAVDDDAIGQRYKSHITEHTGIRLIEPDLFQGYDPTRKEVLQEVAIEEDLEPFEASKATAEAFALRHGDRAIITPVGSDEYRVSLKKGATLLIPKAVSFDRLVAGQIPTGWNPKNYGIPDDIVSSVDPVTLYALCAVAEALLSAGISDPFEIYEYIHLSDIGVSIGSGAGGAQSTRGMYRERWMDLPIQKNVLQETFVNTTAAWVNMLLLGSTGPIKSPVGACATAIEALDIGAADIIIGKVKMCLVGGTDDFNEESSQEFANMQATTNSQEELLQGRSPQEMSRPTTSSRSGFVESQGSGVQLIASAETALQMGLPIHGIIANTTMASDKIGKSVPAPGQGVLTNAREAPSKFPSPLLDISYRREQMDIAQRAINRRRNMQLRMATQPQLPGRKMPIEEDEYLKHQIDAIEQSASRAVKDTKYLFGNNFADQDPTIAPLRAALAVWNLTVDDVDFASLHLSADGTSTTANDKNEIQILDQQMKHLGRSKGNPLFGIAQKYLTGHSKGGAGAYMLNGAFQTLNTGIIPGNRNADNVDEKLRGYDFMVYPNKTLKKRCLKAFSLTSFGFGQKGAQVIGVHPRFVFATLEKEVYEQYRSKNITRQKKTYTHYNKALMTNTVFQAKNYSPYDEHMESKVFLDPLARASRNKDGHFAILPGHKTPTLPRTDSSISLHTSTTPSTAITALSSQQASLAQTPLTTPPSSPPRSASPASPPKQSKGAAQAANVRSLLSNLSLTNDFGKGNMTVGVDVEDIANIPVSNDTFIERNFTSAERAYAKTQPLPEASLAGRWCAKEAIFKSLGVKSQGGGASLKDFEILTDGKGEKPVVKLHGTASAMATEAGVTKIDVSFSHCDSSIVAVALASREK
ncbi:beta subunit of fatty acid synthetase [Lecanora helva]